MKPIDKKKKFFLSIAMILGLLIVSLGAGLLYNKMQYIAENPVVAPVYGEQGLPYGTDLAEVPTRITEDYIYFNDRVVSVFHYDAGAIKESGNAQLDLLQSLPEGVNRYVMLVPTRIAYEGSCNDYTDDEAAAIDELYGMMPEEIHCLDVFGGLQEHRDEYIYFRTDDSWTQLGAYYACQTFLKVAGETPYALTEYQEEKKNFVGKYSEYVALKDYLAYYLLTDGANTQLVTNRKSKGVYDTYEAPMIDLSRTGLSIFIGGTVSHSIIKGDIANGKSIIVYADDPGKILCTWLTPYYENVIYLSSSWYNGTGEEFQALIEDYHVTDFILFQSVKSLTPDSFYSRMKKLTQ